MLKENRSLKPLTSTVCTLGRYDAPRPIAFGNALGEGIVGQIKFDRDEEKIAAIRGQVEAIDKALVPQFNEVIKNGIAPEDYLKIIQNEKTAKGLATIANAIAGIDTSNKTTSEKFGQKTGVDTNPNTVTLSNGDVVEIDNRVSVGQEILEGASSVFNGFRELNETVDLDTLAKIAHITIFGPLAFATDEAFGFIIEKFAGDNIAEAIQSGAEITTAIALGENVATTRSLTSNLEERERLLTEFENSREFDSISNKNAERYNNEITLLTLGNNRQKLTSGGSTDLIMLLLIASGAIGARKALQGRFGSGGRKGVDAPINRAFLSTNDFANLPKTGTIDPKSIRFSQDSISFKFQKPFESQSVDDFIAGLKDGSIEPNSIKPIRIVEKDGKIFTLDNRRLFSFQQAGIDIPFQKLALVPKRQLFKFSTENDGVDIFVKGRNK